MGVIVVECIDRVQLAGNTEDTRCCTSYQRLVSACKKLGH